MKYIVIGMSMVFSLFSQMTESKYIEYLEKTYKKFNITHLKADQLPEQFTLLDTREKNEFEVSHIKNAVLVSYDDFDLESLRQVNKSDTIILYCSVGYRSSVIAEKMIKAGFKNVFNLYGGIFLWANQNRKIVNMSDNYTKKIHGYNKFWSRYIYNENLEKMY